MSFVSRQIDLTLTLASGALNDRGDRSITLRGLRAEVLINNVGSELAFSRAQLRVYGMKMEDMQRFNTLARNVIQQRNDQISISAGDSLTGVRQIFSGNIAYANVNMMSAPNVCLDIAAVPGLYQRMQPAAPNSYPGPSDVATIIQGLCARMGFAFENHGVKVQISDHYACGTLIDQLWDIAETAGILCSIENGTVRIWPNDGAIDDFTIDVSPHTGLIGYPQFTPVGLRVEMEFRNDIIVGRKLNLISSVPQASGEWYINNMTHDLATQLPNGPWKTIALISKQGLTRAR